MKKSLLVPLTGLAAFGFVDHGADVRFHTRLGRGGEGCFGKGQR